MESTERGGVAVHLLANDDFVDLYAWTQTCDELKDGNVFVVASEGIVGFLYAAWPVAVIVPDGAETVDLHGLHTIDWETRDSSPEHPADRYQDSILAACDIAEEDADILGWDSWTSQAESVRKLVLGS